MKQVKILGTGCPKCQKTIALVKEVVAETGADVAVEKVEDIMEIMRYDILSTPAVVVNEKVVLAGRVPTKPEILDLLSR